MPYLFSHDGVLANHYNTRDSRAFIVEGLEQCLQIEDIEKDVRNRTPTTIAGHRVLLYLEEQFLRSMGATVFSESGHDKNESEGIARVIRNRAEHLNVNYGSSNFWFKRIRGGVDGNSMYGRGKPPYANANSIPIENWSGKMASDLEATVRAIVNPQDITGGAYFWEGTELLKDPKHDWRKWLDGDPPIFIIKTRLGKTTFCAYNPNGPRKHNYKKYP